MILRNLVTAFAVAAILTPSADVAAEQNAAAADEPFAIQVVDAATGRGVPMVELRTTDKVRYYTDSAGRVAIREPALRNRRVFFKVRSPGYRMPKRGWFRGVRVRLQPGGSETVEIGRTQLAERLYRVTGRDIYRDTVLLGKDAPIEHPLLNAQVAGQDSVHTVIYRGKLFWFWGDTTRPSFPLGNFETTGAVSRLPGDGGLDPAVGVNLDYFEAENGFVRKMCPIEGDGPVWTRGQVVLDHQGRRTLLCHYARMKSLGERREHGMAVWRDEKQRFEKLKEFPLDSPLHPVGLPTRVKVDGREWLYFTKQGYPVVRVRAEWKHVMDPGRYQGFTCLEAGARWDSDDPPIERNAAGEPVWGWKADTATLQGKAGTLRDVVDGKLKESPRDELVDAYLARGNRERFLEAKGLLETGQGLVAMRNVETGEPVFAANRSSLYWNDYRDRWVMLFQGVAGGELGQVWYAEADTILGPWVYARRVAVHDGYSFYNVKQHPYFAQDGGRVIYFEGTYSKLFTEKTPTPRYNYNQMMYRLDLSDPRLSLPGPVYEVRGDGEIRYGTWEAFEDGAPTAAKVPFYALSPERSSEETVGIYRTETDGASELTTMPPEGNSEPAFLAWPADAETEQTDPTVPLYAYRHEEGAEVVYRPADRAPDGPYTRDEHPMCRVWPSPRLDPPRSRAEPVRRFSRRKKDGTDE